MKIIVAIVVHNRFQNVKRWIKCWHESNTGNAELVIIHNHYGDQTLRGKFQKYVEEKGIKYVSRAALGFDIGAFQDVCKNRLQGFPDYDFLLWCTDDVFPMTKDFISPFIEKLKCENVGISCMQISSSVSAHVRTTGFCLKKEIAERLTFAHDPIVTKEQCYFFEHRGGSRTLTNQIRQMGLSCEAVAPNETSPLWDSGYWRRLDRMAEHEKVFGELSNKVVFICPIFDAFPEIISSLLCQSNKHWELLLIDDNPEETICRAIVETVNDNRIKYIKRSREANYGHPHRKWALNELKENRLSDAEYVLITNGDNYYAPSFIEYMMSGFTDNPLAVACYCSDMVHSYLRWKTQSCRLERGHIDCGGVIVRKDIAVETGWDSVDHSSDWTYFDKIIKKHGAGKWQKIPGTLFMHN